MDIKHNACFGLIEMVAFIDGHGKVFSIPKNKGAV